MHLFENRAGAAAAVAALGLVAWSASASPGMARNETASSAGPSSAAYVHESLKWHSESGTNPHQQDSGECDVYTTFPTLKTQQANQLYMEVKRSDEDDNVGNGTLHKTLIGMTYSQGYAASYGVYPENNRMWARVERDGGPPASTPVLASYLSLNPGEGQFFWNWTKPRIKVLVDTEETDTYPDGRVIQRHLGYYSSFASCGVTVGTAAAPVRQPVGSTPEPQPLSTPANLYHDGTPDGLASADWDLSAFFGAASDR